MKSINYGLAFCGCLALSSCGSKSGHSMSNSSAEGKKIVVNVDDAQSLQASVLFDTVEYVPLETNDTFLVSGVNHLKLTDGGDIYFISDKAFFCFDGKTGKGKTKIARLGGGPEEYVSLFDSYVNPLTHEIELLDNNGKKIVTYDVQGNYVHALPLPFMSFMLTKTSRSDYWLYNNNLISDVCKSKVVHYDADKQKLIEEYFPINKHLAEYFFVEDEKNFVHEGKNLLYMSSSVDTIFRIKETDEVEVAYVLDLDKYKVPYEFYQMNYRDIMEFMNASKGRSYICEFPTFAVNDNSVMVACIKDAKLYLTYYVHETETSCTFADFFDDFHFNKPLELKSKNMHFVMDQHYFYFTITPEQFIELQEEGYKNDEMKEWLKNNSISEVSNPILVKCRLKAE